MHKHNRLALAGVEKRDLYTIVSEARHAVRSLAENQPRLSLARHDQQSKFGLARRRRAPVGLLCSGNIAVEDAIEGLAAALDGGADLDING
jgi:hypothetical protein